MHWMRRAVWVCLGLLPFLAAAGRTAGGGPVPSFGKDVLPLLSDRCFACHGPDPQAVKAGLRLDVRDRAVAPAASGRRAIVPGNPAQSELLRRVTSRTGAVMPPASSHKKPLSPAEAAILRRWIEVGAPWGRLWSLEPIRRPAVPSGARHPVDAFVRQRLRGAGVSPAGPAPPHSLVRRLSWDLTGLPPTPREVQAFTSDASPDAYGRLVDRLLASPHFGERMAMWWLDLARYSDTDGYQADETRTNWPWRDWVVDAFNANMPFDRFTLEQFAGDLLPNATAEQRLATCFHRNHMTNGEGGRDPEESRVDYVIDRINTVGSVWLGLTLNCCQCHSHKYDPISQADYYSLAAFFNSIDEDGKAGRAARPYLAYESPAAKRALAEAQALVEERRAREAAALARAVERFPSWLAEQRRRVERGYRAWKPPDIVRASARAGTTLRPAPGGILDAGGPEPPQDDYRVTLRAPAGAVTGVRLEVFPLADGDYARGEGRHFVLTDVKLQHRRRGSSQLLDVRLAGATADFSDEKGKYGGYGDVRETLDDDPRNGWSTRDAPDGGVRTAVFRLAEPLPAGEADELIFELRHRSTLGRASIGRFRVSLTAEGGPAVESVGVTPLERLAEARGGEPDASLEALLRRQFLEGQPEYQAAKSRLERAEAQLAEVRAASGKVNVMVLAERPKPRETHVLIRGVWDRRGVRVGPGVPAAVLDWPADLPRDRVGLARWLTSPANPLTARVAVNHLWQLVFGRGLVRTPEDFGLQGELPTHAELLDWLAAEFRDSGWDIKRILRLMVTSDTYRQSSQQTAAARARDPENRLLARADRHRLPAWMLRDGALRHAGLLNPALGGPPVRPYQPDGVWEENFMGRFRYVPSEGPAQYRRTLYAFWRRAVAPTFLFDSAQRRVCEVRQPRTNTPLQALTLLNDASQLAAAAALAERARREAPDDAGRIRVIFRTVLARPPGAEEAVELTRRLTGARRHYAAHPADAASFLAAVLPDADPAPPQPVESAALTVLAGLVLNLDEAISRE